MKLAGLSLLEGPERRVRGEAVAKAACEELALSAEDAGRVVAGVAQALELDPREPLLLSIGLSKSETPKVVAWLRGRSDGSPPLDDATLLELADEASIRTLPGGLTAHVLRWRVASARLESPPSSVSGQAAEWLLSILGDCERTLMAERRVRAGTEDLLGVVAHSLRNPIGSISSAADLLQLSPQDPATLEAAVGILSRSSRSALRLIADLEQLNQIDAGTLHLSLQELRPSHVADSAAEVARPLAQRRAVELRVEKNANHAVVMGDNDRLIQAIGNLVVSAVEQSPEKEVVVLRTSAEGGRVIFEIEDRGPHVPPEAVATLFDRLRRTGPRRRSAGAFGLAAARELIEAQGGKLTCVSTAGGTTILRASLPGGGG